MKPISRNARRRAWAPTSCTLPAAKLPRRVAADTLRAALDAGCDDLVECARE